MSVKPLGLQSNWLSLGAKGAFMALVWCAVALSNNLSQAQTGGGSVLYRLNSDSGFMWGCFGPCMCPVSIAEPVKGTFFLTPSGFDGVYFTYAVTDVNWSFTNNNNGIATRVTGSGTYKFGGNAPPRQELSLYLQLNGGKVEHFDSGLVTNLTLWPDIKVSISTNRQYCFDTVFNVDAAPTPVPQMHIGLTSTNTIVLSWAVPYDTFTLQESSAFPTTNWTAVTNTPAVIEQQNQVVLPLSSANRCYRLQPGGH